MNKDNQVNVVLCVVGDLILIYFGMMSRTDQFVFGIGTLLLALIGMIMVILYSLRLMRDKNTNIRLLGELLISPVIILVLYTLVMSIISSK